MPDWTYRTLFKPVIEALPRDQGRILAVRALAGLANMPLGPHVLEFFGHLRPDPRLRCETHGVAWRSPLGIAAEIDPAGVARKAWDAFGLGFVEMPLDSIQAGQRALASRERPILTAGEHDQAKPRPPAKAVHHGSGIEGIPVWIRLRPDSTPRFLSHTKSQGFRPIGCILEIPDTAAPDSWSDALRFLVEGLADPKGGQPKVLVGIEDDIPKGRFEEILRVARESGAAGVRILSKERSGGNDAEGVNASLPHVLDRIRWVRDQWGSLALVMAGAMGTPRDALALHNASADLLALDTRMWASGPGLPKRIHAALLFQRTALEESSEPRAPSRWSSWSWFWCALLGVSMILGGLLALAVASTRVVLPYDEVFCGTTREGLAAINPRLLPFMAHDRVTLAGTMVSIGALYLGLALFSVRRGLHWAKTTIVWSATAGFLSFFLFLGFGYFDPFHAFVSAVLFQVLLLAMHAPLTPTLPVPFPELDDGPAWRRGQWGQLLFVMLGTGLFVAGLVIASIGVGQVFVREDLEYMQTSVALLRAANPRLIPLVAHDRASLGGMLVANGLTVWLAAQWGFTAGARGLWWTFLLAGLPAFVAAIGVHLAVGYTDPAHLAPAFAALALFIAALALSRAWLCDTESHRRKAWQALLSDRVSTSHPASGPRSSPVPASGSA